MNGAAGRIRLLDYCTWHQPGSSEIAPVPRKSRTLTSKASCSPDRAGASKGADWLDFIRSYPLPEPRASNLVSLFSTIDHDFDEYA